MDDIPETIPTAGGTAWHLRKDVAASRMTDDKPSTRDAKSSDVKSGVVYEYGRTGTLGVATGRMSASIAAKDFDDAEKALAALGLKIHILQGGKSVAFVMEHGEKLGALRLLEKISQVKGIGVVSAEILMLKSKR